VIIQALLHAVMPSNLFVSWVEDMLLLMKLKYSGNLVAGTISKTNYQVYINVTNKQQCSRLQDTISDLTILQEYNDTAM